MDASLQTLIDEQYGKIVEKMGGMTTLFGCRIDTDDTKQVVVAAYYMAQAECNKRMMDYHALDMQLDAAARRGNERTP